MDKHNENKTPAPQQDVIVLGVASVETRGGGAVPGEMIGRQGPSEISEE